MLKRLETARVELQKSAGADVRAILDGVVTTLSLLKDGRDLMPYAPVQHAASGSWGSDMTLSWVRQTRMGGSGWEDDWAVPPLSEDAEEYELEILDGPGGTVLRTETGLASPELTYTTAMQGEDFLSAQTGLTFRVYQISAQVGRGFPGEATVEV